MAKQFFVPAPAAAGVRGLASAAFTGDVKNEAANQDRYIIPYYLRYSNLVAKAWVNFNGTGIVAIRDSHNVSSITDNGVGNYTINFQNALAAADHVTIGSAGTSSGRMVGLLGSPATTSANIGVMWTGDGTVRDEAYVTAVTFGKF